MRFLGTSILGLTLALVGSVAFGEIPDTLGFQGRLNRPGEGPVDGVFSMTINIYNTNSGGLPLFTEFHSNVAVTKGRFNIELGSVDPVTNALSDSLDFTEKYFLGITVAGDSEMTPRLPFNSVAYAQRAAAAAKADEAQQSSQSATAAFADALGSYAVKTIPVGVHVMIPGGSISGATAQCLPGYVATGGGYRLDFNTPLYIRVVQSAPSGSNGQPPTSWVIVIKNFSSADVPVNGAAYVVCVRSELI